MTDKDTRIILLESTLATANIVIERQQKEIKRLETLAELGNMRANDYRAMRNRALKAESEIERLKEDVSFGQRTCKEWAETCDELTEKLNATIAGQETLQKALAERNAEIERLLTEFARLKEETTQPYLLINYDDKSFEVLRKALKMAEPSPLDKKNRGDTV